MYTAKFPFFPACWQNDDENYWYMETWDLYVNMMVLYICTQEGDFRTFIFSLETFAITRTQLGHPGTGGLMHLATSFKVFHLCTAL